MAVMVVMVVEAGCWRREDRQGVHVGYVVVMVVKWRSACVCVLLERYFHEGKVGQGAKDDRRSDVRMREGRIYLFEKKVGKCRSI